MSEEPRKEHRRITVDLTRELHTRLRIEAAKRETTIQALVLSLIEELLDKSERETAG